MRRRFDVAYRVGKGVSNWVSKTFDEFKNTQKINHFAFNFRGQNLQGLLSFQFMLLDPDNKKLNLLTTKRKSAY